MTIVSSSYAATSSWTQKGIYNPSATTITIGSGVSYPNTISTGNIVSVADAQRVNQFVLGTATPAGFDFHSSDVNGDNQITISDAYVIFGRIAGRFNTWVNNVKDIKFFTATEYNTISTATTNLTATTPGVTNFTYDIVAGQPNSVTYYVLGMGDANGTGI